MVDLAQVYGDGGRLLEAKKSTNMLSVRDIHTSYGAIAALQGVSFDVPRGSVVALVGANGAGKSTTLNTISGILQPNKGSIHFENEEITGWRADRVTSRGLIQVPEGRRILGNLTVEENLLLGAYTRRDGETHEDLLEIYYRFPHLKTRRQQIADSLSGGEQQMLAFGRALMARPKLLMLDEPSLGLAPLIVKEVFQIVSELKDRATILLVEQNARKALHVSDYAYVMEGGRIVQEGPSAELQHDSRIVEAYLGRAR
jgi:branched-chain amino acid transport system ATP-binding protein